MLPSQQPAWKALENHYQEIKQQQMRDWFEVDQNRFERFSVALNEILFDYSKNRISDETLRLLCELAKAVKLPEKIKALFAAEAVNTTEGRPALHVALRNKDETFSSQQVDPQNIKNLVAATLNKMSGFVTAVHEGKWRGSTGKAIRDVVNIGIGGSHLGPLMATHALASYAVSDLGFHFISDVDSFALQSTLNKLDPERSLFIISSKSFTTIETLTNLEACYAWLRERLGLACDQNQQILNEHFVAVTSQGQKAQAFGLNEENIFPIWDWVGGRYSVWSAIGLPLALQIGMDGFHEFLAGAHQADQHFYSAELAQNIPVLMGLLGIWYINFFNAVTHAVVPYSHRLQHFRAHLQQLDMESNGKRITHLGLETDYATGPVVWGELGLHGQHAFHQLLHQGTHFIPVDFLLVGQEKNTFSLHQDLLIANALSQAEALMQGKELHHFTQELHEKGYAASAALQLAKHKEIPGNRPSNIFFIKELTPSNLGTLLALYEHKIFVQSVIWDINPFDQWGVELGKTLLPDILADINQDQVLSERDSSTSNLILHYKKMRSEQ